MQNNYEILIADSPSSLVKKVNSDDRWAPLGAAFTYYDPVSDRGAFRTNIKWCQTIIRKDVDTHDGN